MKESLESNLYCILDFAGIKASFKALCPENILILLSFKYIEIITPLYLALISLIVFKSLLEELNILKFNIITRSKKCN